MYLNKVKVRLKKYIYNIKEISLTITHLIIIGVALITSMICSTLKENQSVYIENGKLCYRIKTDQRRHDSKNVDSKDLLKVIASQFDKLSLDAKIVLKICAIAGISRFIIFIA